MRAFFECILRFLHGRHGLARCLFGEAPSSELHAVREERRSVMADLKAQTDQVKAAASQQALVADEVHRDAREKIHAIRNSNFAKSYGDRGLRVVAGALGMAHRRPSG